MKITQKAILSVIPILVLSSICLWLFETPMNLLLYFFEIALILILYRFLSGNLEETTFKVRRRIVRGVDYSFLAMALMLLALTILKSNNTVSLVMATFVAFFLPGYFVLKVVKFTFVNSWMEWIVLSFAISIGITSLAFNAVLFFAEQQKALVMLLMYVNISLFLVLRGWTEKHEPLWASANTTGLEFSCLLWISVFFVFAVTALYPRMAYAFGLDIVQLFSSSRLLALVPSVGQSYYPWFHMPCATVYELSYPQTAAFQQGLAYLSLVTIVSFYIMAKAYLTKASKYAPVLATLLFSTFSGFGWLIFLNEKLSTFGVGNQIQMLQASDNMSYWDVSVGQGPWLFFWFRPMTVAFALFFVLLYLLLRQDISRRKFLMVFSFLVITLGSIHSAELVLFNIFLLALTFFMARTPDLRLKDASLATFVGNIIYFFYNWVSAMSGIAKAQTTDLALISIGLTAISCILAFGMEKRLTKFFNSSVDRFVGSTRVFAVAIALFCTTAIVTWLTSPSVFSVAYVIETYYIPLMMYPVLLGTVGLLAIHGFVIIMKEHRNSLVIIFVILFSVAFASARIVSFLHTDVSDPGYGERRWLPLLFTSVSTLASLSLVEQTKKFAYNKRKLVFSALLSLIVVSGVTSTYLSIEYWRLLAPSISPETLDSIEFMSSPMNRDIGTPILTAANTTTINLARYIPSPYYIDAYRYPVWESGYPEFPLLILFNNRYPPSYVFLSREDSDYVSNHYANGYFKRNLLNLLPKAYSNTQYEVFRAPVGAPPSLHSETVLVVPDDSGTDYMLAYDMLSLGKYDYTVSLISDTETIKAGKTIVTTQDDSSIKKLLDDVSELAEDGKKEKEIIILNFNGYGPFAEIFFNSENASKYISAALISGPKSSLELPVEVSSPILSEREQSNILAWYSDGDEQTPFAAELINGTIRVVYVNVYPIIRDGLWMTDSMSDILKGIIEVVGLHLPFHDGYENWIYEGSGAFFKEAELEGNITIDSSSFTDLKPDEPASVSVIADLKQESTSYVTRLYVNRADYVRIDAKGVQIQQGKGFYTRLTTLDSTISLSGGNVSITLEISYEGAREIEFQNGTILIPGQLTFYVREPRFNVEGEARFKTMYSLFSAYPLLRSNGHELDIRGSIEFQLPLSDTYSFASALKWNGVVKRQPQLLLWNERDSLKNMAPWFIISLAITIPLYLKYCKKHRIFHSNKYPDQSIGTLRIRKQNQQIYWL